MCVSVFASVNGCAGGCGGVCLSELEVGRKRTDIRAQLPYMISAQRTQHFTLFDKSSFS